MAPEAQPIIPRATTVVCRDEETGSFAAWCEELDVATSGPTAEAAADALVEAMRVAADFALRHAQSVGPTFFAQLPLAEWVARASDAEIKERVDVHL
jgi:predicted RNase H-like HicB family nuclease